LIAKLRSIQIIESLFKSLEIVTYQSNKIFANQQKCYSLDSPIL